jgi:hypothetical protein
LLVQDGEGGEVLSNLFTPHYLHFFPFFSFFTLLISYVVSL